MCFKQEITENCTLIHSGNIKNETCFMTYNANIWELVGNER